jgi:hypothetical protein
MHTTELHAGAAMTAAQLQVRHTRAVQLPPSGTSCIFILVCQA